MCNFFSLFRVVSYLVEGVRNFYARILLINLHRPSFIVFTRKTIDVEFRSIIVYRIIIEFILIFVRLRFFPLLCSILFYLIWFIAAIFIRGETAGQFESIIFCAVIVTVIVAKWIYSNLYVSFVPLCVRSFLPAFYCFVVRMDPLNLLLWQWMKSEV